MEDELLRLKSEASASLDAAANDKALEAFRIKYLGRKGLFTSVMCNLGKIAAEDRPRFGQLANTIKKELETAFDARKAQFSCAVGSAKQRSAGDDQILPGRALPFGRLHPGTKVMEEICTVFERLGFTVAEGPDVEIDFYNFEGLNIPKHHPARDMHDTVYVSSNVLLRTHTLPMQVGAMKNF